MVDKGLFWINGVVFQYREIFGKNTYPFVSILEYCENTGFSIPHYCYHKNLSIAGNCRMCLVEMSKSPKPVVSCSLNAQSSFVGNNKIYTNSPLVKKSRENIMEFLLLNHPLDCPICDQGGECDLQDQSLFFGLTRKRFYHQKRFVHNKYLGLIVKTVMTRCIHCTRCVRFATEIAGIEELGLFGRGSKSEIGTYVTQLFNSELSGNLIDICPVGALTSKPYPFMYRDWELKKIKAIDPSDGFGTNILVYLKNNAIVKILPGYPTQDYFHETHFFSPVLWITDKTRFVFDGMCSITDLTQKSMSNWNGLLKRILINIYILDHLANHNLVLNSFTFLIDENTNVETLSILLLLKRRYKFFKLKRSIKTFSDFNLDFFLKTNQIDNTKDLSQANACLFVGTSVRYESPYLNIKLKKRNTAGNFRVFTIGSRLTLTFPSINLGANLEKLRNLCEGSASSGIIFKTMRKTFSLINTESCQRWDSSSLLHLLKHFNNKHTSSNWHVFNLLNTSLNSLGLSYFNKFQNLLAHDLIRTNGFFLISNSTRSYSVLEAYTEHTLLSSLLERKYLYFPPTFFIEQTSIPQLTRAQITKLFFHNYYSLISNNFFETSGSYMTSQGFHKHVVKFLEPETNSKEDWQILRKFFCTLSNVSFIGDIRCSISFNLKNMQQFRSYISFIYKASQTLTNLTFFFHAKSQAFVIKPLFFSKTQLCLTQFKIWIKDFYIGGFDCYSRHSKLMIHSSINLRNSVNTFI